MVFDPILVAELSYFFAGKKRFFFFNAEIPMFAGQPPLSFCEKYVDHW